MAPRRPSSRGIDSPTGRGPLPRRASHWSTSAVDGQDLGHLDPLGQGRRRGEERLARRQLGHQGPAPRRVELGEHVVEQQRRHQRGPGAAPARGRPRRRARARQRCSPWDAWVRASRPSIARQQVVTVRPDRVDAPAQVVGAAGGQRVEQVAVPAPFVPLLHEVASALAGQAAVGGGHQGLQVGGQPLPGRHQDFAGVGEPLVPHVEGCHDVRAAPPTGLAQQRGPLAQDAIGLVCRAGPLGVEQRQRVVEQVPPALGATADDGEVLGREDRAGRGSGQLLAAGDGLAVHPGAAAAGGEDLRLDQARAVRRRRSRPGRSHARPRSAPWPPAGRRGRSGGSRDTRAPRARSSCPCRWAR